MARGWKVGRWRVDVVEGEWIMVPITVVGRGILGMRSGGIRGVRVVGGRLLLDGGGEIVLEGVLVMCLLVLRN